MKELKMYSLERRRDRYRLIYCWKMLEGTVPVVGIESNWSPRRGRLIKSLHANRSNAHNFCSLVEKGWNHLPKDLRNLSGVSVDTFKHHLDRFLSLIEDNPHLSNEKTRRCNNDIMSAISYVKEDTRRKTGTALLSTLL